jgi:hypothetical protein
MTSRTPNRRNPHRRRTSTGWQVSPLDRRLLAGLVALLVLGAGVAYALARPATYTSNAALMLTPAPGDPTAVPQLLDSFDRSGTAGTYVELITARDTLARAGSPPVTVTARAVPDTRVIDISATGARGDVQRGLTAVLAAAQQANAALRDVWRLNTLAAPSAPAAAGPSAALIIGAALALAALAALFVVVVLRRLAPGPGEAPVGARASDSYGAIHEPAERPAGPRARTR